MEYLFEQSLLFGRSLSLILVAIALFFFFLGFGDFRRYPNLGSMRFQDLQIDGQNFSWLRITLLTLLLPLGIVGAEAISSWAAPLAHSQQMHPLQIPLWYFGMTICAGLAASGFYNVINIASALGYWIAWKLLGPNPRLFQDKNLPPMRNNPEVMFSSGVYKNMNIPTVIKKSKTIYEE